MGLSKIEQITPNGTWDSQHGLLYKQEVTFEDGTLLNAYSKTQTPPYSIGDLREYVVKKENSFGKLGTISKPQMADSTTPPGSSQPARSQQQFKADPLKQASIELQVCLKEANLFFASHGFEGETDTAVRIAKICEAAKMIQETLFK